MHETLDRMSSHRLGETEHVSAPTPEDLMLRIAEGNENAFEQLYDRLSSRSLG